MRLHIRHETIYTYDSPVQNSIQYIRLTPRNTPQQRVHDWQLTTPGEVSQMTDGFGNPVTVMTLDNAVTEISLVAEGIVDLTGKPLTKNDSPFPPQVFLRQTRLTEADQALKDFVQSYSANKRGLIRLMKDLRERVEFMPGATTVTHSASEAFGQGAGVCQDHTHIFLACCRHIGVPARYVSGYIHSANDDHVATHAWAEAWIGSNWAHLRCGQYPECGGKPYQTGGGAGLSGCSAGTGCAQRRWHGTHDHQGPGKPDRRQSVTKNRQKAQETTHTLCRISLD